jgi:hypothetical protein
MGLKAALIGSMVLGAGSRGIEILRHAYNKPLGETFEDMAATYD